MPVRLVSPAQAREYEPHVRCVAALRVESTGIVDYRGVCDVLAALIREAGGEVRLGTEITGIDSSFDGVTVRTPDAEVRADWFVNCAGLHSDRLARLAGFEPAVRIIPFRGEYYELTPAAEPLVRGLIYPVPDPALPFLGVHLTRMIGGGVHAGPNAVLALAREGYTWRDVDRHDVADSLRWPGLWRMGRRWLRTGVAGGATVAVAGAVPGQPARAGARPAGRLPGAGRRRGCVPRPSGATAPWSTTSTTNGASGRCTC